VTQKANTRSRWKRVIVGIVFVFVMLPVLLAGGMAIWRSQQQRTPSAKIIVPDLKGLDLETAESRARQAQLTPRVMLRRWDLQAPVGTIVGQVPEAGMSVPAGTTIGLELCIQDPNKPSANPDKQKTKP
jgi:beta-lactam-binding protein with PASTA domain